MAEEITTQILKDKMPKDLYEKVSDFFKKLRAEGFNAFTPAPIPAPAAPAALAAPPVPIPPAAPSPQETLLDDGITTLKYNTPTLAVGSVVTVVGPDGELPAPIGDLKLQDGTTVTVKNDGTTSTVESITPAASAPPAPASIAMPAMVAQMSEMKTEYEAKFAAFAAQEVTWKEKFEAQKKELDALSATFKAFTDIMEPVLSIPSGDPTETPKNKFALGVTSKADKLMKLNTSTK